MTRSSTTSSRAEGELRDAVEATWGAELGGDREDWKALDHALDRYDEATRAIKEYLQQARQQ
jgi:hypothetical protein